MKYVFTILFIMIINCFSLNAENKSVLYYGLYAKGGYNISVADFRMLPGVQGCCPQYNSGYGPLFEMGLSGKYKIGNKFNLTLDVGYFKSYIKLESIEDEVLSVDYMPYDGQFEHIIESDFSGISLNPSLEYRISPKLNLSVGPSIHYYTGSNYHQWEKIIAPADRGVFTDTKTNLRNDTSGSIQNLNTLNYMLRLALNYEYDLFDDGRIYLYPEIGFNYSFSDIIKDLTWKNHFAYIGLKVLVNEKKEQISKPRIKIKPKKEEPKTKIKPEEPKELITKTDFDIRVVGVEDDVEQPVLLIKSEEYLYFALKPLLNYVFYEENSSEIPERYYLLNNDEIDTFEVSQLKRKSTLDIYHNILNIIGKRMQIYPKAKVELVGCNSNLNEEAKNLLLSEERAVSVMNYLKNSWNINENRIKIRKRNLPAEPSNNTKQDGIEENRRVEILSDEWEIIKPVTISDTTIKVSPPVLRFYIDSYTEENDIKWEINVFHNSNHLTNYRGDGKPDEKIDLQLETLLNNEIEAGDSLKYIMTVTHNNTDNTLTYKGFIPIDKLTIKKKIEENKKNVRIEKFNLILFSYDKFSLNKLNQRIADIINERISPDSKIEIIAYTDRTGTEEHNMQLSVNRAKSAAGVINGKNMIHKGLGESVLLFDNNLPEGRFYSRTVEIIIETEIK